MSLTLYKPLGSNDDKERLDAAKQLSSELTTLIAGEKSAESEKSLNYALKRLTRGLASGANSSRPGFSVVLTELVRELLKEENSQKWGIKHADVLKAVVDNTASQGGVSGQEERDHWLGRMFGLESLMLSGAFFGAEWKELLERIFEVANKKPWLCETAAFAVAKAQGDAEVTWQMVQDAGLAKTGEGVGIWLSLAARGQQIGQNPLSMKKLMETAKVLKESGSEEEGIKSKGSWNAKLGFVWDLCLDVYFGKDEAGVKKTSVSWEDFWRVVIDGELHLMKRDNNADLTRKLIRQLLQRPTQDLGIPILHQSSQPRRESRAAYPYVLQELYAFLDQPARRRRPPSPRLGRKGF
jgi:DNA polymerase phi